MTRAWHRIYRLTAAYVAVELAALGALYHFGPNFL